METMSQFATEKDLWKARCLRFATALIDVMDGMKDHDIQAETGLPQEDCDRIAKARANARELVHNAGVERHAPESDCGSDEAGVRVSARTTCSAAIVKE